MTDLAPHNRLWAELLVDELARQGVALFVVCPGSRSTPLALALAEMHPERCLVHIDERGAAFAALGFARASGKPAAVVTTSGTAVANLMPAVVEARMDGVPLVLVTADRPPETRFTHANQTIDQGKFFGDQVVWAYEPPAPTPDADPAVMLTAAAAAVRHATHAGGGPVHLNLPFREPLISDAPPLPVPPHLERWHASGLPYTSNVAPATFVNAAPLVDTLDGVERGLVIVGPGGDAYHAHLLADRLGWPLLPDIRSDARLGPQPTVAAPFYDLALASEAFAAAHRPDAVLHLGGMPVSKRLLAFLTDSAPTTWAIVHPSPDRIDPAHRVTHRVVADPMLFASDLLGALDPQPHGHWLAAWRAASDAVAATLTDLYDRESKPPLPPDTDTAEAVEADPAADLFDPERGLTEPTVARLVARMLPEAEPLVVAASMPIRDLDQTAPVGGRSSWIIANRGASGIDGTVATAAGVARASEHGATLLVGDLALLHDLNSLMLLRSGKRVVVVAINNDGGGIFSMLPVAQHAPEAFEPMFGTPHGLSFQRFAEGFGLDYWDVDAPIGLEAALRFAYAQDASTLIEVTTNRAANAAVHREAMRRVVQAVDAAVSGRSGGTGETIRQPE